MLGQALANKTPSSSPQEGWAGGQPNEVRAQEKTIHLSPFIIHYYSRADLAPRKRPPCFLILADVSAGGRSRAPSPLFPNFSGRVRGGCASAYRLYWVSVF